MKDRKFSRRGFTLVEMLVVIGILLAVTAMVVVTLRPSDGDKMRTAGRIGQSAILGARDRALHAKQRRGFRLIIDPNDSTIATGFLYVQPIDLQTYGVHSIALERYDTDRNGVADAGVTDVTIVHGFRTQSLPTDATVDWPSISPFFTNPGRIRIPAGTGVWYTFAALTAAPYPVTANDVFLQLSTPFIDSALGLPAPNATCIDRTNTTFTTCDVELANEIMPNHMPVSLPSGVVIDLTPGRSSLTALQDLMFSPSGTIAGPVSALGPIYLLLRDIRDVTEGIDPKNVATGVQHRENLILAIFPQTGHVASYPIDQTDTNGDGVADDLFQFAKAGSRAGG